MAAVPSAKQIEEANRSILYGYAYSIPPVNRDFPASISATTIKYIESMASFLGIIEETIFKGVVNK